MVSDSCRVADVFILNTNSSHQCLSSASSAHPLSIFCKASAILVSPQISISIYVIAFLAMCCPPDPFVKTARATLKQCKFGHTVTLLLDCRCKNGRGQRGAGPHLWAPWTAAICISCYHSTLHHISLRLASRTRNLRKLLRMQQSAALCLQSGY